MVSGCTSDQTVGANTSVRGGADSKKAGCTGGLGVRAATRDSGYTAGDTGWASSDSKGGYTEVNGRRDLKADTD